MAYFDESTGEIVVRIVYDGLGTAGKTSNLRALHAAFPSRTKDGVITPEETVAGRTVFFDWLELAAGHLDDWPLRCQIVTVPGQFVYANRRFHLLRQIDAAVLVCDSSERGVDAGAIALTFLQEALRSTMNQGVPVILQANKQDLAGALPPERVEARLTHAVDAVVGATASTGDGVRLTLLRAIDLVRKRVRSQMGSTGPRALPRSDATAAELYEALLLSDGDESHAVALESALARLP